MNCDPLAGKAGRKVKGEELEDMEDGSTEIELFEEWFGSIFDDIDDWKMYLMY